MAAPNERLMRRLAFAAALLFIPAALTIGPPPLHASGSRCCRSRSSGTHASYSAGHHSGSHSGRYMGGGGGSSHKGGHYTNPQGSHTYGSHRH